jgi:soluble lytic murein transglycosylase-like protein
VPDYLAYLDQLADKHGVPRNELRMIYQLETSGGRNVRPSSAGAQGHMQLMPGTAREMGVRDINDPYQNLEGGAKYYAIQRRKFGDPALAAAAYNAGPGRVMGAGNRVPNIDETRGYVANFLKGIGRVRPGPAL